MPAPRASTGRFVAGLVGLFVCSTMAWLLLWAGATSLLHGSAPVLVASGSMGPSVRAGDLVVLEPYHSQDIEPGMVIRFDDPEGRGSVLHRVVEVAEDGTIRTKGDANTVVDSSVVEAGRITGVGQFLVPRAGLPVLWWRAGEWFALAVFAWVTLTALFVTRYALLDTHDPWREPLGPPPLRPPWRVSVPDVVARFRASVARDGPVLLARRFVLRRGAELTALGLAVAFLGTSTTAWAAWSDTTGNQNSSFSAADLSGPSGLGLTPAGCNGASAIVFVDRATATTTVGSTVTVSRPAGVAAGQFLVAHANFRTNNLTATITAPAGWTQLRLDDDGTSQVQGVFTTWAGAGEPSSYAFTLSGGSILGGQASAAVTAYDGVDTTAPVDAHAVATASTGAAITGPSVTTTVAGTRLLTLVGQRASGGGTPPAGMAERYDVSAGSQNRIQLADQAITAAGATGSRTATASSSGAWIAQSVALRPRQISVVGTGATGTAVNGSAGSIDLARPSGVASGDVLIAHVVVHTHGFTAPLIDAPSGWNTVRIDDDGNHVAAGVFWRAATGSEPSSYTFTNVSGDPTQQATGAIMAYRGVDAADPIDDDAAATDITGNPDVVAPSVTTTRPSTRLLSLIGVYGNDQGPATPPAGMTERYEGTVLAESAVVEALGEASDQLVAAAGATGTRTTAVPAAATWVAQSVALRPYSADPYADLSWTPSSSPGVDGYVVERWIGGTLDDSSTVTPGTASWFTDGPLTAGTTYTYRVIATDGSWRSAPATSTFTPTAC